MLCIHGLVCRLADEVQFTWKLTATCSVLLRLLLSTMIRTFVVAAPIAAISLLLRLSFQGT